MTLIIHLALFIPFCQVFLGVNASLFDFCQPTSLITCLHSPFISIPYHPSDHSPCSRIMLFAHLVILHCHYSSLILNDKVQVSLQPSLWRDSFYGTIPSNKGRMMYGGHIWFSLAKSRFICIISKLYGDGILGYSFVCMYILGGVFMSQINEV